MTTPSPQYLTDNPAALNEFIDRFDVSFQDALLLLLYDRLLIPALIDIPFRLRWLVFLGFNNNRVFTKL
jgi:hypothetical protein